MRKGKNTGREQVGIYVAACRLLILPLLLVANGTLFAQTCPPNIDFENGTFSGWTCWAGNVFANGSSNQIVLNPSGGPMQGRHTLLSAYQNNPLDEFGDFPVTCPNGSGYSIKLGNDLGGAEAEGVSYEFSIPSDRNFYSLIYHYAVVFEDPRHLINEQPRMEIEIMNISDNQLINCSSFTFVPFGTVLPGFRLSDNPGHGTPVWVKDWSAVSINLDNLAGKTIRLFFKTADCTFRRHFGYAYIDVNSECSSNFLGAAYCPSDTAIDVFAPYGYQAYRWYNIDFTQFLGSTQRLHLAPPPPSGTTLAVILTPYQGYGCLDTLYAQLADTLDVVAIAGPDTVSCNGNPVPIGTIPKPGLKYEWSPVTGLSDAYVANPLATPPVTTTYYLKVSTLGGGCVQYDTVKVIADNLDTSIVLLGKMSYCIGSGDSAVLRVKPADSIQWYRNNVAIPGANQTIYRVLQTGTYHARMFSFGGCILNTTSFPIDISSIPVSGFTVSKDTQCLKGNKFILTNSSTNSVGGMQYHWTLGDGTLSTDRDVIHSYTKAGVYTVKLVVNSNTVCADSSLHTVVVNENAIADFSVRPICIKLPLQLVNKTIDTMPSPVNYLWNLGNGQTSTLRNPPVQIYTTEGVYPISLSVSTVQCPLPLSTVKHYVIVDKPVTAMRYPVQYAVVNLPKDLAARQIGENILWQPARYLDATTVFNPVFNGPSDQEYQIQLTTKSGCVTIDTQLVKTVKNIVVYVPTAFTPNGDGTNDYLRPLSFGIKMVNYFRVFNRWGQLVFEMHSDQPGWDGTYKGVHLEMQTVAWTFRGMGADGNIYQRSGTSVLVR